MKRVLIIDDSPGEARIMSEAFKIAAPEVIVKWVKNAEEAISFLNMEPPFQEELHPDLILLDLNMPGTDGRELLSIFKKDDHINHIPILVMSNSTYPEDINYCYKLNANCYLNKPSGFDQVIRLVELIREFWLNTIKTTLSIV
jgi:two-component system, chemotaxis family, response regulator Rcp1